MTERVSYTGAVPLADRTDDGLVVIWAIAQEAEKVACDQRQRAESEMERRMVERKATAILNPYFDVRLETSYSLDAEALRPLAERIPPSEWERGFTEAHEETVKVPAKADLRVVKGWAKYGEDIAAGIERAKIAGPAKVRVIAVRYQHEKEGKTP